MSIFQKYFIPIIGIILGLALLLVLPTLIGIAFFYPLAAVVDYLVGKYDSVFLSLMTATILVLGFVYSGNIIDKYFKFIKAKREYEEHQLISENSDGNSSKWSRKSTFYQNQITNTKAQLAKAIHPLRRISWK